MEVFTFLDLANWCGLKHAGFVCVRGFEQETRAPRPLSSRLHFVASKLMKTKKDEKD